MSVSQVFMLESGEKIRAFHIGEGKYLAFVGVAKQAKSNDLLKYDAFMGLILFSGKKIIPKYDLIPITQNIKNLQLAAIAEDSITKGSILHAQESLKKPAIFSNKIPPNAVISDICYQSYGVGVGENRFIDNGYIVRFLSDLGSDSNRVYSDIGFEVKSQNNALIVSYVNPFIIFTPLNTNNAKAKQATTTSQTSQTPPLPTLQTSQTLRVGDELLAINGVAIKNENMFFDIASNLDISKRAIIRIRRGDKMLEFAFLPLKRERDFGDKGTMLDFFGVIVDNQLNVIKATSASIFRIEDRILRLNQIIVANKAELDSAILRVLGDKRDFSFLITRNDFEFFILLKNPQMRTNESIR